MFPWKITVKILDDKNKEVHKGIYPDQYFATISSAKAWGQKKGDEFVRLSKRTDIWYTVEVE